MNKPVHELTDDKLRREMAEAQGWFVTWWFNHRAWQATKDGEIVAWGENANSYEECWVKLFEMSHCPNWPSDSEAALELARHVLDRLNDECDARALSELALMGLQKLGGVK